MTLKQLCTGCSGRITRIEAQGPLSKKLSDMGFLPGREVRMVRFSPFRDPVEVSIVGYQVGIRRNEADCVQIEPVA